MLLNSEELLALVNGDLEPDRLADLLDRLEHCPESADALQVLVALRANREEALSALHDAQEREVAASASVTPHPAARAPAPTVSWAAQGLRIAATVAIVAVVSVWAASGYFGGGDAVDTSGLATTAFENVFGDNLPPGSDLTADGPAEAMLVQAREELEKANYEQAKHIIAGAPLIQSAPKGLVYLGMSHYFLGEYDDAVARFEELRERVNAGENIDSMVSHQAAWYLANALLALDRPLDAMDVLEEVRSARGYWFQPQAAELYAAVRRALGLTSPGATRD